MFVIRDSEAGNPICRCLTLEEAQEVVNDYEQIDKEEKSYTPGFYEIYDTTTNEVVE